MKQRICLLALPLLSIAACLDMSDQDSTDGTSSQASVTTLDPGGLPGSPQADAIIGGTSTICETYGGSRCVGAPTIAFEDPVLETATGRFLQIAPVAGVAGGVTLAFATDPTRCVAVKNASSLVEVRACSVQSAIWIPQLGSDGHSCIFQNHLNKEYLGGPNTGGQFNVVGKNATGGWLKQFTLSFLPRGFFPCGF
jgi:hypothetical protein